MTFHSVRHALIWFAKHGDGFRAAWPDPAHLPSRRAPTREEVRLTAVAIGEALERLHPVQRALIARVYLRDEDPFEVARLCHQTRNRIIRRLACAHAFLTSQLRGLLTEREDEA